MNPILDFSSYTDTGPEKMFMILFGGDKFPSHLTTDKINPEIIKYLNKNAEFVCEYKYSSNEDSEKVVEDDALGSMFSGGRAQCDIEYYQDLSVKGEPLLYRLYSTDEGTSLSLLCYNAKRIEALQSKLLKKYLLADNYDKNTYFGLLYKDSYGIKVKQLPLKVGPWDNLEIECNYGNEFKEIDKTIKDKLINNNNNGIILLNGSPGTGKSFYIKHLSKTCGKNNKFIFIPPHYVDSLSSPDLLPILLRNKNSILVIEDGEKSILSRETNSGHESLVSTLLNLSDGVLADILGIKIIITFNTDIDKIDKAITRKGRMLYQHEFKALSRENSQILLDKLGKNHKTDKAMTVSEIYNLEKENGHKEEIKNERVIGFGK